MKTYPNEPYPFQAPDLVSYRTCVSAIVGLAFVGLLLLAAAFLVPVAPATAPAPRAKAPAPRLASEQYRQNQAAAARGEVN